MKKSLQIMLLHGRLHNHPVLRELPFFLETPRDDAGHGEEITWLKEHYRN